jgi:hypothetical protein
MASLKAVKPAGEGTPRPLQSSKPAPKKAEQKPREPKKKVYFYICPCLLPELIVLSSCCAS